jgi:hypothetical protein
MNHNPRRTARKSRFAHFCTWIESHDRADRSQRVEIKPLLSCFMYIDLAGRIFLCPIQRPRCLFTITPSPSEAYIPIHSRNGTFDMGVGDGVSERDEAGKSRWIEKQNSKILTIINASALFIHFMNYSDRSSIHAKSIEIRCRCSRSIEGHYCPWDPLCQIHSITMLI